MPDVNVQKMTTASDRALPIFAEFDKLADRIRIEAYNLFARRGATEGHALDDWLSAERAFCWPSAKLVERDSEYVLKVALAGFEPKEISVTATPREIMIKAGHTHRASSGDDKSAVRWSEFGSDDVYRRVALPADLDIDKTSARFENGLLEIVAPKARTAARSTAKVPVSAPS